MAFNIGVNVVEVDGKASPAIAAPPLSVAAFLVQSSRGIPNLPISVAGMVDFVANFGTFAPNFYGAHAVRGFFDNGGSQAYVVRVVNAASALPAIVVLRDRANTNTLIVTAGSHGMPDPGLWGNSLRVAIADHARANSLIPAQIVGANAEPFNVAANGVLSLTMNGAAVPNIVFAATDFAVAGAATAQEVANAINRRMTAVRAAVAPGRQIVLVSGVAGAASRIVVAGASAAALGFTAATANSDAALGGATIAAVQGTGGLLAGSAGRFETRGMTVAPNPLQPGALPANPALGVVVDGSPAQVIVFRATDFAGGLATPTIGEAVAAINRQASSFVASLAYDNHLVLMSNSYGPASSIALSAPGGTNNDAGANLGMAGNAPVAGIAAHVSLDSVSDQYRLLTWTGALPNLFPANSARLRSMEFDLVLSQNGITVETFTSLSMQAGLPYNAVAVVNDAVSGSRYITLTAVANVNGPGVNLPAVGPGFVLGSSQAGTDGTAPADIDFIGDPATRSGLHAFDTVGISLLACPETTSPAVVAGALSYCENRGDAMYVGTAPYGYDLDGIKTYASAFRARKVFGAMYAPWIEITNPLDTNGLHPMIWVPPVGHVLGVYARIADGRGVWKAPAGDEALLQDALGVEFAMTDTDHTDLVKNGSVNGIRAIPGSGIIIDASRTLSTDTRWLFVGTRRLFDYVKVALRDGLRWVAQEPNSDELRRSVKFNVVTPFLLGLWRQGAFGTDPADKVFTVRCDASNNPPAEVVLGHFKVEVFFYPVKPAETIVIVVGQQDAGGSAAEA